MVKNPFIYLFILFVFFGSQSFCQNAGDTESAKKLYLEGNTKEAISVYGNILKSNPEDIEAQKGLGTILVEEDKRLLINDPTNVNLHIKLARELRWIKRFDEAFKEYDEAIKLDNKNIIAYKEKGQTLVWVGRMREAFEQYKAVLSINADDAEAKAAYENLKPKQRMELTYNTYENLGREGLIEISNQNTSTLYYSPLSFDSSLFIGYSSMSYWTEEDPKTDAFSYTVGVDNKFFDNNYCYLKCNSVLYPDLKKNSTNYYFGYEQSYPATGYFKLNIYRVDVIESKTTLLDSIYSDSIQTIGSYLLGKNVELGANVIYSGYSDRNNSSNISGQVSYQLFDYPTEFKIIGQSGSVKFNETKKVYWAPLLYSYQNLMFSFKHSFFSDNMYYLIQYSIGSDSDLVSISGLNSEIQYIYSNFNFKARYISTFSDVYKSRNLTLSIGMVF